jgi:hypothetical protein
MRKVFVGILFLCLLLTSIGGVYLLFLQIAFPKLVPSYGAGENISLNSNNDYSLQIPWKANSRLHLNFQTDKQVNLYLNGYFLCTCDSYNFTIEPGDTALIRLEANSKVSGMFTAWQEVPVEKQMLAIVMIIAGLIGIFLSFVINKRGFYKARKTGK